jgi:hypothetical protein
MAAHSTSLAPPPPPLTPAADVRLRLAPTPDSTLVATVVVGKGRPVSQGGDRTEKAYPLHAVADIVQGLAGRPDVYVSTHAFHGWRRSDLARRLCSIVIDLDYGHDPGNRWTRRPPELVAEAVIAALRDEGVPAPNRLVSSGRGLYVQWLLEPVSARAAPRYQAVVRRLAKILTDWSPDVGAGTRLTSYFRVVGSVNSGTGTVVREVWRGAHPEHRWPFEDLAAEILPRSRDEVRDLRRAATERRVRVASLAAARAERRAAGAGPRPARTLTSASYWQGVLDDVHRLVAHRGGSLPPGGRDGALFVAGVALSWTTDAEAVGDELNRLADAWGRWDSDETRARMSAVLIRAKEAAAGRTREHQGRKVDPRYRMRVETVRQWLDVTDEEAEAAGLRVLLGAEQRRGAEAERLREHRRKQGARSHEQRARDREDVARRHADLLAQEPGLSIRDAAVRLGVSKSALARIAGNPRPSGVSQNRTGVCSSGGACPAARSSQIRPVPGVHRGDPFPEPTAPPSAAADPGTGGSCGPPGTVAPRVPFHLIGLRALRLATMRAEGYAPAPLRPRVTPDPDPPLPSSGLRALRLASVRPEDPDPVRIPSLPSGLSKLRLAAMRAETPAPPRRRRPRPDLRDDWPDEDPPALSFPVPQPGLPEPPLGTDAWWAWFDAGLVSL